MYGAVTHFVAQPTTLDERLVAAKKLEKELSKIDTKGRMQIFVDDMENSTSRAFGALPERLAIVFESKLVFLGGRGPEDYSIEECRLGLKTLLGKSAR
jgi:hypothetical protein